MDSKNIFPLGTDRGDLAGGGRSRCRPESGPGRFSRPAQQRCLRVTSTLSPMCMTRCPVPGSTVTVIHIRLPTGRLRTHDLHQLRPHRSPDGGYDPEVRLRPAGRWARQLGGWGRRSRAVGAIYPDTGRSVELHAYRIDQRAGDAGRYDHLANPSDGLGSGAYTTTLSTYFMSYFWLPNGRILRTRLDLSYAIPVELSVGDRSVYGPLAGST